MTRRRIFSALCAIALGAGSLTAGASSLGNETVVIENARIITVTGPAIERGSVLIRDGKIAAVGATVQAPSGARRIDATGMSVYPGMIDSASAIGLVEIGSVPATIDQTEIGDVNPQLYAFSAFNPHSELIPSARVAGITTVVAIPQGGTFAGQPVVADLHGWTVEEMTLERSAGLVFNFPSGLGGGSFDQATQSFRRTSDTEAKKAREKRLDEIRALFEEARAYERGMAAKAALARNLKLEALLPILAGKLPVAVVASDFRDVKRAAEFCEEQKLRMILATNAQLGTEDLDGVARYLAGKRIAVVLGPQYALPRREDDRYDLPQRLPAALARAGVKFAFGTNDSAQARDLPYMAAMAVAYGGLSKEDAVKALTIWPAEIWGVADRVGSIEVGKYANLIVTTGDPLEVMTDVRHVFIEGKTVPMTSRQVELYETFRQRR